MYKEKSNAYKLLKMLKKIFNLIFNLIYLIFLYIKPLIRILMQIGEKICYLLADNIIEI